MKFNEWWLKERVWEDAEGNEKYCAQKSWDACKKEILSIIKSSTHTTNGIQIYFGPGQEKIEKLTKEIEKL